MELSIVIICKNDAAGIERTLTSADGLGANVLVYDSGSADGSKEIALKHKAQLYEGVEESYGHMRFKAAQLAKYDWILMLHTGEVIDDELKEALAHLDFTKIKMVYRIRFKNYFGAKWLRFGEWGRYSHIRLANRKAVKVKGNIVDEKIFSQTGIEIRSIRGYIIHYPIKSSSEFAKKIMNDAFLAATKYQRKGKKAGVIKLFFSPLFAFVKNYFLKLGFLDGQAGYVCAKMGAWYTFLKYTRLRELNVIAKTPL